MASVMEAVVDALLQGTLLTFSAVSALPVGMRSALITSQAFMPGVAPKVREVCGAVTSGVTQGLGVVLSTLVVHMAIVFLVALVVGFVLDDATDFEHSAKITAAMCVCAAIAGVLVASSTSDREWRAAVGRTLTDLVLLLPIVIAGMYAGAQMRKPDARNIRELKAGAGHWLAVSATLVLAQILFVSVV